jgi:hypothetical protein
MVTGLALDIYNHGLVNPQASGTAKSKAGIEIKPSYIDPRQFASAFVEVAGIASNASTTTAAQSTARSRASQSAACRRRCRAWPTARAAI